MTKQRTILLTGGTGYLGSHLLKALVNEGHSVILLKRKTSNTTRIKDELSRIQTFDLDGGDDLESVFKLHRPELILHCATNYGRDAIAPLQLIEANLILPLRLLELAKEYFVGAFINTDTILDKGVNYYSLSKKQFLDWMTAEANYLKCINIALEHFYGPFDNSSKFVSFIVGKLLHSVPSVDLTEGQQRRDFIHIDDVAAAFMRVIAELDQFPMGLTHLEVGCGEPVSIRDFVTLAQDLSRNQVTRLNFGALPYRKNEVMESRADVSKLLNLNWRPRVSLRDGLADMIEQERNRIREEGSPCAT